MNISRSFNFRNDKEAKLRILLTLYSGFHSTSLDLRGSVERLTIWGCGLILLLDGWLVTDQIPVTMKTKTVITIGIVIFTSIVALVIRSIQQRYIGVQQAIIRINHAQMAYEKGAFFEDETLLPEHWKERVGRVWKEPIFQIAYISLAVVGVFGVIIIWLVL